jgi:NADPH:quinone reductase-like Zn-dependent oxidoreductase
MVDGVVCAREAPATSRPRGTFHAETRDMKAIVYDEYGSPDVLHVTQLTKPVPRDDELLIRIHAAHVNFGDLLARNFKSVTPRRFNMPSVLWLLARLAFGIRRPRKRILGSELAGEVEAVGSAVTRFKPGDQVFGYRGEQMGAYAEYLCMPEAGVVAHKPANLTHAEAASIPYGAIHALNALKKAKVQAGQRVLINGASGGIGSAAVQLAKAHFGAHVTGVCSTANVELVRSLGADRVIDYTREDFSRNGDTYDVIIDILGKGSFARYRTSLAPSGTLLFVSFKTKQLIQMLWTSIRGGRKVICTLLPAVAEDLVVVKDLVESGKFVAVVETYFPLERACDAHRYVEQGHEPAHVAITV